MYHLKNFSKTEVNFIITFSVCMLILAPNMITSSWNGNEIMYYDQAFFLVNPQMLLKNFSNFDDPSSRFASFWLMGNIIKIFGFEAAKFVLGLIFIFIYSIIISLIGRTLKLSPLAIIFCLLLFLKSQSLFGGEWVFGSIEPKSFAYVLVLLSILCAIDCRQWAAIFFAVIGTYFHFLVGGFWGFAIILYFALNSKSLSAISKMLGVFIILVAPMVIQLIIHRSTGTIDLTMIDLSIREIYSAFRHPHHTAPIANGFRSFVGSWLPGTIIHFFLCVIFLKLSKPSDAKNASIFLWLSILNGYLVFSIVAALIDSQTHFIASLYIFRPASIVLFMSILVCVKILTSSFVVKNQFITNSLFISIILIAVLPDYTVRLGQLVTKNWNEYSIVSDFTEQQKGVVGWISQNTEPGEIILIETEGLNFDGNSFPGGVERMTNRPLYVNYKFIPTNPSLIAEWYRRLKLREAIFKGNCDEIYRIGVKVIVASKSTTKLNLSGCSLNYEKLGKYQIYKAAYH